MGAEFKQTNQPRKRKPQRLRWPQVTRRRETAIASPSACISQEKRCFCRRCARLRPAVSALTGRRP